MQPTTVDRSRALWRRQALLTIVTTVAFMGVAFISAIVADTWDEAQARRRLSLPAPDTTLLVVALVVAAVVTVALLAAVCVHAYRIATLTFRRGED
ncbi:MAG TPA: hypothetical protein VF230_10110 [Acidimicrobiales bacterium]